MFQFSGFASIPYAFRYEFPINREGCPIRTSQDHSSVTSFPGLFAGSHVLHRLSTPRHPPHALHNFVTTTRSRQWHFRDQSPSRIDYRYQNHWDTDCVPGGIRNKSRIPILLSCHLKPRRTKPSNLIMTRSLYKWLSNSVSVRYSLQRGDRRTSSY